MKPSARLFSDSVSVETYEGQGAYGALFGAAVTVPCRLSVTRKLVRNADGAEVVSEATIYVKPEDGASFAPGASVTIGTRASTVISVAPMGRPGQTDLVAVTCT